MTENDLKKIRAEYQPKVDHYNEVVGDEFGIMVWNNRNGFDVLLPESARSPIETWCKVTVPEHLKDVLVTERDNLPPRCYKCHAPMTAVEIVLGEGTTYLCGNHIPSVSYKL